MSNGEDWIGTIVLTGEDAVYDSEGGMVLDLLECDGSGVDGGVYPILDNLLGSTFNYANFTFSTGIDYVGGLCVTEEYLWAVSWYDKACYKYSQDGVYQNYSFSCDEASEPQGICWDGSNFWIVYYSDDMVRKYTSEGVYTGDNFSVSSQDNAPRGICWDGTYFWVCGYSSDAVHKYTSEGDYTGFSFSVSSEDTNPTGICWDGTYFWVSFLGDYIFKYTSEGVYTSEFLYVGSQLKDTNSITLINNGSMWLYGESGEIYNYKYELLLPTLTTPDPTGRTTYKIIADKTE